MIKKYKLKINNKYFAELPLFPKKLNSDTKPRIKAFISLKKSGDMHIENIEERVNYFAKLSIAYSRVSGLKQLHSKDIKIVTNKTFGPGDKGDGLITANKQAVLAVTVADCIPICIYDKETGVFAILHSGWRGTGIIDNAIKLMKEKYKSKPTNIYITIGPGIGSCCYEVSKDLYEQFKMVYGKNTVRMKENQYYMDLKQANINLLKKFNIENITVIEDCTFCNNLLSSFRRDGKDDFIRMNVSIGYF